jgi:hypothetical protein
VKALRALWSSAATAVAVIASVVALAFSAWPALRPDPRDALAARLHVETVEPAVTLDEYLQRTDLHLDAATPSALRTRGHVVYLHVQIEGRKHADLELHQVLYRASTRGRIRDQGPTRDGFFRADTPNDQWIYEVFVPDPPYDFAVFVRLELFDGRSLLAIANTPPIRTTP